jgi:histidine triad (HIT) family protein
MADCIFCSIVAGKSPRTLVEEDERVIAFMDVNPATEGHLLVVPKAHSDDLRDADPDDLAAAMLMVQGLSRRVTDRLGADGVNLVGCSGRAAWQSVFHTHLHVVPRYDGDPLRLPWRVTPGDAGEIAAAAARLVAD